MLKQDCVIADSTGTAQLTLWEKNVGTLSTDQSYQLSGLLIRSFKGLKYLSIPKENFSVKDIGAVSQAETDGEKKNVLTNVVIRAVRFFENYRTCYACKAKVTPSDTLAQCNKSNTLQRLDKCSSQATAKIELVSDTENQCKMLTCFSPIIEEICCASNPSVEALLFAEK